MKLDQGQIEISAQKAFFIEEFTFFFINKIILLLFFQKYKCSNSTKNIVIRT